MTHGYSPPNIYQSLPKKKKKNPDKKLQVRYSVRKCNVNKVPIIVAKVQRTTSSIFCIHITSLLRTYSRLFTTSYAQHSCNRGTRQ